MAQGTVKWFSEEKGYGFISPRDGGQDIFVEDIFVRHSAAAAAPGFGTLYEGELVAYEVARDGWGPTAENVCVLRRSPATHTVTTPR